MKFINIISFLFLFEPVLSQPFINEINAFKKQDSISFPGKGQILFTGSSSFRMWKDVQDYFPDHQIINRGFGGSSLPDLIRYEKDIIFPYEPKEIVIYCGENDVAASDTITARIVLNRFKTLFTDIRSKWPAIPLVFVSLKPSPSRWQMKDRMMAANELIRKFLKKKKHTSFVDVWKPMLGPDGKPREALFIEDKLHMNARGYAIWKELIEPKLLH
jgi:lysophospholipase L1-like esterase